MWGDITTVSDAGLDAANPVDYLSDEIARLAIKHKLSPNHFRYDVGGGRVGEYSKSLMKLALPRRPELQNIIKTRVEPFIRNLAEISGSATRFTCNQDGAKFTVDYDPSQMYAGGGHTSYDVALSLTNNPIFKAPKAKTAQLNAAPPDALRLIIRCDADCAAMSRQNVPPGQFSSRAIAADFLRQNSSVDLVLLASVRRYSSGWDQLGVLQVEAHLVVGRTGSHPGLTEVAISTVQAALDQAVSIFHQPILEPINAARRCMGQDYPIGMRGGYMTSGTGTIKISSRALLQLLAGDLTTEQFQESHGWSPVKADGSDSFFKQALQAGRAIKAVNVEPAGDKDDDWIEFELTAPDPAFSPFRVRRT